MRKSRSLTPAATEAAKLLGGRIRLARRERRWTLQEMADRVGVIHDGALVVCDTPGRVAASVDPRVRALLEAWPVLPEAEPLH